MINAFATDTAMLDPNADMTNLARLTIPCLFMNPEIMEYYMEQFLIKDSRPNRLAINYRPTEFSNDYNPFLFHTMNYLPIDTEANMDANPTQTTGIAEFTELDNSEGADNNGLPPLPKAMTISKMNFITDRTKINADYTALSTMSDNARETLLNIVEYLIYGTISSDTEADIDAMLTDAPAFTNDPSLYGYKSNSLTLSPGRSVVFVYDTLNIWRFIPNWFQFTFTVDGVDITFKIWTNRKDFENNYPLFNIIEVIPPLKVSTLLNPSSLPNNIYAAVNESSIATITKLTTRVHEDGHSGYVGYTAPYVFNDASYDLTFSILYKGRRPSAFEQRAAIVNYLLQFATEDVWVLLFPSLFVVEQFFFVPIYENFIGESNNRYPSICNVGVISDRTHAILDNIVINDFSTLEVMSVAYNKMFIGVVNGRTDSETSLSSIFDTYQDWSTTEHNFINLDEAAQAFSSRFNHLLSVAFGETNSGVFYENIIDDKLFFSFILNSMEFIVISRPDYTMTIA